MKNEIIIPTVVIVLAIAFLDPFMVLMPSMMVYTLLAVLLILFSVFALFILKERALDEREELHRATADRFAYIAGSGVLVLGIVYQVLVVHHVDELLVLALVAMTVAKFACLYIAHRTN